MPKSFATITLNLRFRLLGHILSTIGERQALRTYKDEMRTLTSPSERNATYHACEGKPEVSEAALPTKHLQNTTQTTNSGHAIAKHHTRVLALSFALGSLLKLGPLLKLWPRRWWRSDTLIGLTHLRHSPAKTNWENYNPANTNTLLAFLLAARCCHPHA